MVVDPDHRPGLCPGEEPRESGRIYPEYLGSRTGCNLEDEEGLEAFLQAYRDKIANSELPESPELGRTVFRAGPEDRFGKHDRDCEKWRAAGIAMWYVMGEMHQGSSQEELKQRLYDLYERHGKPTHGLRAEMGERNEAAR